MWHIYCESVTELWHKAALVVRALHICGTRQGSAKGSPIANLQEVKQQSNGEETSMPAQRFCCGSLATGLACASLMSFIAPAVQQAPNAPESEPDERRVARYTPGSGAVTGRVRLLAVRGRGRETAAEERGEEGARRGPQTRAVPARPHHHFHRVITSGGGSAPSESRVARSQSRECPVWERLGTSKVEFVIGNGELLTKAI